MEEAGNATITGLERELADASQVIAELTAKLERANETIEGLEATIGSLRQERDRERALASRNWDALSDRIARLEEAGDAMATYAHANDAKTWLEAKEAKP
jgi:capsule polysaccharide export protein KpsE/RkpR